MAFPMQPKRHGCWHHQKRSNEEFFYKQGQFVIKFPKKVQTVKMSEFLPHLLSSCLHDEGRRDAEEARSISSRAAVAIFSLVLISSCVFGGALVHLGCLPASASALLLLVEWRPAGDSSAPFIPPDASSSQGRQSSASRVSAAVSSSLVEMAQRSHRPKWFVPGDGGFRLRLVLCRRTGLRFCCLFWGPLCKMQGLACNFLFSVGPCVTCALMLI